MELPPISYANSEPFKRYVTLRGNLPLYPQTNLINPHVSRIILKFVYFLVVNSNKYSSHVVDTIIFGISVPDFP